MVATFEVSDPDFSGDNPANASVEDFPADAVNSAPQVTLTQEPGSLISSAGFQPWQGDERISVLLLGIDQRCEETGPTHSDSIMLVTMDPMGLTASVLSFPRDLWVHIPDFGSDRINQANYLGEVYEYPGGGPALAKETVSNLLGVPIDYFVAINFDAFVEVVDIIGGITVDVPETISDFKYPDRCYGYDPFNIEAGVQQLSGAEALKYARTRATFGGDVDRAARQQSVILAARDKVLQFELMPQLLAQAPALWQTSQENIRTNLKLDELVQLALLAQNIPQENISTAVIDYNYVYNQITPDGRQVLVPIHSNIRQLRDSLFAPPAAPTPVFENLPAEMAAENARVAVYNGTPVFGLAAETQTYLQGFDLNINEIGNADAATFITTQIITYGEFPNTVRYLTQLMHIPPLNISNGTTPGGAFDILIILGDDWRVPGP
jgi:LCP family protein required for cell wall assembly